ncbi:MAG: thioredoxin family protein [Sulfurimonas sp.]|uniref:thioredoxin family protein n=1 Tax=Sulfurimonas sp. TaxID=2022749 RepID=UPI0025DE833A|nr:thioredoxin family protein [Sulfurimonas sp.]MCK9453967.1 thioredoxin family protein [Sulfurimonas sp.]
MRKIFIFLVLGILINLFASEIKWMKDYHEGIKVAQQSTKPILFVSSSHACKYCVILDNTTFKDAKVIEELNKNFVSVISYSDENDYLPTELWRPGTPAIWFLMPNGEPMYEPLMGAMNAENFLKALSIVEEEFNKEIEKK